LGREQVLDVKLRSSQVRAARYRLAAVGFAAVFGFVLTGYVFWRAGEWGLNRLVYENKAFAIRDLDLQTDGIIAVDQLRRWAGVRVDDNLLALDLARVKRDLELVPLVQSASVERILPHTLRVRVVEREPIAQINVPRPAADGGIDLVTYQIDSDGYVMLPLDAHERAQPPSQTAEPLPGLGGISPNDLQPGRRIEAAPVQAALQLILAFDRSAMASLVELKRIDVSAADALTLTTGQGSEITFGLADLDQQLRRWHEVYDGCQKQGKAIATLDLAVTNNVPVRWLEASAAPPPAPKLPQPLRTRKKHV
jgi:cell division septal protein FtsQ